MAIIREGKEVKLRGTKELLEEVSPAIKELGPSGSLNVPEQKKGEPTTESHFSPEQMESGNIDVDPEKLLRQPEEGGVAS